MFKIHVLMTCAVSLPENSSGYLLAQLSFQEWTQQMRDMLEARKRGDLAFRDKEFKNAIDCYSQVYFDFGCENGLGHVLFFIMSH